MQNACKTIITVGEQYLVVKDLTAGRVGQHGRTVALERLGAPIKHPRGS